MESRKDFIDMITIHVPNSIKVSAFRYTKENRIDELLPSGSYEIMSWDSYLKCFQVKSQETDILYYVHENEFKNKE